MDIMWELNENASLAREKPEKRQDCLVAMLYACQRAELDMSAQYVRLKQQLLDIFGTDKENNALCNMICEMIADSDNRAASFAKAAALLQGHEMPKPKEYDKAVKNG